MKKVMFLVVMLLIVAPVFAQEATTEDVDALKQDLVNNKVALLAQRIATVQAKANWLDRERILLQQEQTLLQVDIAKVADEIAEILGCEAGYDLQKRACKPAVDESEK